jgi:hypothetical protein
MFAIIKDNGTIREHTTSMLKNFSNADVGRVIKYIPPLRLFACLYITNGETNEHTYSNAVYIKSLALRDIDSPKATAIIPNAGTIEQSIQKVM